MSTYHPLPAHRPGPAARDHVAARPVPPPRPEASRIAGGLAVVRNPHRRRPPSDVSVSIETVGGHCLEGACGGTVTIAADGTVHADRSRSPPTSGRSPSSTLDALIVEIEQADFDAIKSQPFTDTCPIAFDGQQFIYTFPVGSQVEKIDSCEVVVDPANPLFVAVEAALAEVAPS